MSVLRAFLATALLVPALSSAEPAQFRCEARGGSPWREYRTAHFLVATDLSGARAEALVGNLEQLHALVVQALVGEQVEILGRVRAVVFADPRDFERLARKGAAGYFKVDTFKSPTVVFAAEGFQADPRIVAHELAHVVSWHLFPRQPRWFAEGLALFVETVARPREPAMAATGSHFVRGGREAGGRWAGLAPTQLVRFLREEAAAMPEDLLTETGGAFAHDMERYYPWSWLLYHWLWNTRPKGFADFTARLSNAEEPARAWRETFPDLDPARPDAMQGLAKVLEAYRRGGRFVSYEVKAAFDARFAVSPLAPAEVHLRVILARSRPTTPEDFAAEQEEGLREDPHHPVFLWETAKTPDERRAAMRRATVHRADDWRSWYFLAMALDADAERAEKEAALRKAVALAPDAAQPRNSLAWFLFENGRAKEAIPHANAALDLAPWEPAVIDTLAAVASETGKCREAIVLQRRAVALVHSPSQREGFQKRLEEIEARCPAPAPVR